MDDDEQFKDDFFEYREASQFKALSIDGGLNRFSAIQSLVSRAERQLSICYARDVTDFANQMEGILLEHYEAVYQGERKSAYIPTGSMDDGPSEITSLKEVFMHYVAKSNDNVDGLVMWGCRFATLALMKAAEAIELRNDLLAADAAIDAMDAVGFAEIIELEWAAGRTRQERDAARKKLVDADRIRKEAAANKKQVLATAGAKGGANRGAKSTPLKQWAVSMARQRKGNAGEIARNLLLILPKKFCELDLVDFERAMADAIRADRKLEKPALRNR